MNGFIERRDERRRRAAEARAAGAHSGEESGCGSPAVASSRAPFSSGSASPAESPRPFFFSDSSAEALSWCRERAAALRAEAAESRDKASCLCAEPQRSRLLSLAEIQETQAQALLAAAEAAEREASLSAPRVSPRARGDAPEASRSDEGGRRLQPANKNCRPLGALPQLGSSALASSPRSLQLLPARLAYPAHALREEDLAGGRRSREGLEGLQLPLERRLPAAAMRPGVEAEGFLASPPGADGRPHQTQVAAEPFSPSGRRGVAHGCGEGLTANGSCDMGAGEPSPFDPPWVRRAHALRREAAEQRDRAGCVRGPRQRGLLLVAEKKEREAEELLLHRGCEPPASPSQRPASSFAAFNAAWEAAEAAVARPPVDALLDAPHGRLSPSGVRARAEGLWCSRQVDAASRRGDRGASPSGVGGERKPAAESGGESRRSARVRELQEEAAVARDKAALVRGARRRALLTVAERKEQQAELLSDAASDDGATDPHGGGGLRGDPRAPLAATTADSAPWMREETRETGRGRRRSADVHVAADAAVTRKNRAAGDAAWGDARPCGSREEDRFINGLLSPRALATLPPRVYAEVQRLQREAEVIRDKASCCTGAKARQLRSMADIKERQAEELVHPPRRGSPPHATGGGPGARDALGDGAAASAARTASHAPPFVSATHQERARLTSQASSLRLTTEEAQGLPGRPRAGLGGTGEPSRVLTTLSVSPPAFEAPDGDQANAFRDGAENREATMRDADDDADHPLAHCEDWRRSRQLFREVRQHREQASCVARSRQRLLLSMAAAKERLAEELKAKAEASLPPALRTKLQRGGGDRYSAFAASGQDTLLLPPPPSTFPTGDAGLPGVAGGSPPLSARALLRDEDPQSPPYVVALRRASGSQTQAPPAERVKVEEGEPRRPSLGELKRQYDLLQEQLHLVQEQLQLYHEREAHEEQQRRLEAIQQIEREETEAAQHLATEMDAEFEFQKR
ncbi:hypothetical protein BESB_055740 [Besnoitia besnoiti]|uniref:Uncharacterized protein n=1 Tax=Besnoitia besnoiti TaxID=94643 RepID=A0A2A9MJU4_BESBE|nr:hypothetical protein BESB_055740 [Besnoitia besnoiti]PFH35923.1 hypothetical protein BESB_055740 [Besnoitia besnoiti]